MEDILEAVKNNPKPKVQKYVADGRVFPYPKGELLQILKGFDSMSDEDAYDLISKQLYSILRDIFNRNSRDYLFLLKTPKFLTILTQVVSVDGLSYDEKVWCNSFVYKFLTAIGENEKEIYMRHLLFILGEAINKKEVRRLVGCGAGEELATLLAVSLNSSFEPEICIKRFNFALSTGNPLFIDAKKAIEIYEAVFDHVTNLVIYTLFDTEIRDSRDEDWVTEDVSYARWALIYAVMIILESMPPIEITHVLMSVSEEFKWRNCNQDECVISFHKMDKNIFNKVSIIVEQLEGDGYVFP